MNTTGIFTNPRLTKALTGLSQKEFYSLLPAFEEARYVALKTHSR